MRLSTITSERGAGVARPCPALVAAALVLLPGLSWACTGLYAGKKATADGVTIIARTVDAPPWTAGHRIDVQPRVENAPGRQYRALVSGVTWDLPATTWHCVSTPRMTVHGRGRMDSACVNEKGVAITGTTTAHVNAKVLEVDPYVGTGFAEESMPGLLGLCAGTAREAVELLGRAIAEKGHQGTEIYMFADKDEAWYVEVYTGHQWAAVRMPEDAVSVYGNMLMLRGYDPAAPDALHSPGLVSVAEKAGTLVRLPDGRIDLFRSYSAPVGHYSNYRTWFGHRMLAPDTAGEFVASEPGPLFYRPARPVTRRDLFEVMRTRYEGVNCPEENGDLKIRTIGTTKQSTCHLLEVRGDLPESMCATAWVTFGNAEHIPFLPVNAAISRVEVPYAVNVRTGNWESLDPGTASAHFRRLAALAEIDRVNYGTGVRQHWRKLEDRLLAEYPEVLARAAADYGTDPKAAAATLSGYGCRVQREALSDAKRLLDQLLWYVTANNQIEGDGSGAKSRPAKPFACWAPPARRTKVLFFFDTEDFTCDLSNDAIRDIANILREEGVRGQFAMIGYLGKYLEDMKRQDVIDALRHHLIGSQTLYHSKHPNIVEYGDVADYSAAYRRTMEEESLGFDLLAHAFPGQRVTWCSVFPGNANSYVGLYVHSKLGSQFFGGGNKSFTPGEREAAWFVNQFHLPYYRQLHLESFIPPAKPIDIPARLEELSAHEYVTLYMHPHMAVSKRHFDGPNFNPRDPVAWGNWRPTPKRDRADVAVYYERLRTLVRALKADPRFDVTDCERLAASFAPRKSIGRKEIPAIRASLLQRLGPIGSSWCVADAFQAAVELLRGRESHKPGYVYGFLEPPKGVARPTRVAAADLRKAAEGIDLGTFIPPSITVGGREIGPADFLYAALEALETGANEVVAIPRDQLGPIASLMPSLSTYSMKGGWPLYEDTFEDKYLTPRLRLQLWTLRYEK